MEVQISRDGEVIARIQLENLKQAVSVGNVRGEDYAWHEGMTEWVLVTTLLGSKDNQTATTSKTSKNGGSTKKGKKEPRNENAWRNDPATEKQLKFLAELGIIPKGSITKGEASDLIGPRADAQRENNEDRKWEALAEADRKRSELISRNPAHWLHQEVARVEGEITSLDLKAETAKAFLTEKKNLLSSLKKNLRETSGNDERSAIEDEIMDVEMEIDSTELDPTDVVSDKRDWMEELKTAKSVRVKFWKACFQKDWFETDDGAEFTEWYDAVDTAYGSFGHRFKVPTNKQITQILDALDRQVANWDVSADEATCHFFVALEQSFPDSVKQGGKKLKASQQKSGCLVLFVACIVVYNILRRTLTF